jgi:uncharacterized protein YqjF (DUF2071 family)
MHPALTLLDHRPWPLPFGRWRWRQSWLDLLFAHWPVPAADLRRFVPEELTIQEYGGTSWVGVVPFRMTGVMIRPLPDLPWVSAFPELNVRLYVEKDGKPGVWFLSLDATNALAVWAARRFFYLPYRRARIEFECRPPEFRYRSRLVGTGPTARFEASYRPMSERFNPQPGSLESFLVERYCLYARSPDGRMYRGEVHHAPWPLHRAAAEVDATELLGTHGLSVGPETPILHYSPGVDVVLWPLARLT